SHEVSLSVSNSVGVATSNFTCTCYWAVPPPPPMGSEENPWWIGDDVQAYTNGVGGLVFVGSGATSNFTGAASLPWAAVADSIEEVSIPDSVTTVGDNLWAGLGDGVVINGESIASRRKIATGLPAADPSGSISGAEFERIEILDGMAYLSVSVATNADLTATAEAWQQADVEGVRRESDGTVTLTVPVPAEKGFLILKSKGVK
ncbi:MAG: hypothetical protein Q4G65_15745, partial [bacterium]|nr:hypothetical protein [bacterium]